MADRQPIPEDPTDAEWESFWAQVSGLGKGGCEEWVGTVFTHGYGAFWYRSKERRAHRVAYVWLYGEPGNVLDHRCNNKRCVRAHPAHVWPSTPRENTLRGDAPPAINARKTKPDCGHDERFTYVDPRGWRGCSVCRDEATRRWRQEHRDKINARRRARRVRVTHEPRVCDARGCFVAYMPVRADSHYCSSACYQRERRRLMSES